jgi:hypothetical protein
MQTTLHLGLSVRSLRAAFTAFSILGLLAAVPMRAQEPAPPPPSESVADAAKNAREQKTAVDATMPGKKTLTNDDIAPPAPAPVPATTDSEATDDKAPAAAVPGAKSAAPAASAAPQAATAAGSQPADSGCTTDTEEKLNGEVQAAQDELDQLRRELAPNAPVITGGDVDMSNFKQGSSGVDFHSPALSDSQPQAPGRIQEVELEQKLAALKESAKLACEPAKEAGVQRQLDDAEKQLKLLQQEFDLDSSAYYSNPSYTDNAAGKSKLDAEQDQINSLQSEIERLKSELPTKPE